MVTRDELRETAGLAYLALDENEFELLFGALQESLAYLALMQAAGESQNPAQPTNSLLATIAGRVDSQGFRSDTPANNAHSNGINPTPLGNAQALGGDLIQNAGERNGRFIVVPNVL